MNSLISLASRLAVSTPRASIFTSAAQNSVFMKRQKKMDPEVAKQREGRRRKRLEKEIRQMQKHSKKPKPVDEMTIDVKSAKNIDERRREPTVLSEDQIDERAIAVKEYNRSRNELQRKDDKWVRAALHAQNKALRELKLVSPELYAAAVAPPTWSLPLTIEGPALTPAIPQYESPDGDYVDTTRTWS